MINIRPATRDDFPALLEMARAMHAESPRYRGIPLSEEKLGHLILQLHGHPLTGALFVADLGGVIIGTMWGYLAEYFFSEERMATDVLLYVSPEHRRGRTARRLAEAFEQWGAERGALNIQPGVSTCVNNTGCARFYERMGYHVTGFNLSKAASDV